MCASQNVFSFTHLLLPKWHRMCWTWLINSFTSHRINRCEVMCLSSLPLLQNSAKSSAMFCWSNASLRSGLELCCFITEKHYSDATWASSCLRSPSARVFIEQFRTNIIETSKVCITGSLWREFLGDRWIPLTKGQYCGKCHNIFMILWNRYMPAKTPLIQVLIKCQMSVDWCQDPLLFLSLL